MRKPERQGTCACGTAVARHFDARNAFIGCAKAQAGDTTVGARATAELRRILAEAYAVRVRPTFRVIAGARS